MKRITLILALLAFVLSPMMVSQASAAPVKHHRLTVKHRKLVKKQKHAVKRLAARHHKSA